MAVLEPPQDVRSMIIDKQWLQQKFAEMDLMSGFVLDATVTIEKLHEMMLADGIRPEDNSFSRDIIRSRYPEDFEDEE